MFSFYGNFIEYGFKRKKRLTLQPLKARHLIFETKRVWLNRINFNKMPVKIRLQRRGRKKRPFYHIVIADARSPRDGRFIEKIGTYNPMTSPATIDLDRDRAFDWLMKGAQPTETTRAILRFKGVLYKKHLMRGVNKGALTQEQADAKLVEWLAEKDTKIAARIAQSIEDKKAELVRISGKAKAIAPIVEKAAASGSAPAPEEQKSFAESVEQTTIETVSQETPAPEAPAEEAAPVAEEVAAPVVEEAPAPVVEAEAPAEEKAADDLRKIEGIGPKIAEVLTAGGIATYADLAGATPEKIKEVLDAAEGNFAAHDPATWPAQSKMAAEGKWDELKKWQDELDGGKVVETKKED